MSTAASASPSHPTGTCPSCGKPLPPGVPMGLCPQCLLQSGFNTGTEPDADGPGPPAFKAPPIEEIARHFPQFEILRLLGQGGMGAVYQARQPTLDRIIALKVLPPQTAGDPGFAERFNREARALARLNHPNIVAIHEFGEAGGWHFLVMEFVDGPNLRQIQRSERLSPEQALAIVPQICDALQFAHNAGIVHRDIKPENILLDSRARVKITDFGIAKILGAPGSQMSLTGARDVVGTPHYMAPEQVETPQRVDHRADIFSLGVVFYELLTGELPLGRFAAPSSRAHGVHVDVRLDQVVLRALEKEPERRYQHAKDVKTDVEAIRADESSSRHAGTVGGETGASVPAAPANLTPPPGPSPAIPEFRPAQSPLPTPPHSRRFAWLALALFLTGTLGTLILLALRGRDELALLFGATALVFALVLGFLGRRERLARGVAWATVVLFVSVGLVMAILSEAIPLPWTTRERARIQAALMEAQAARAAAQRAALDRIQTASNAAASPTPANPADATPRSVPPVVIQTYPRSGTDNVEPTINTLRVMFSRPMQDGSWSWSAWTPESFPPTNGAPYYLPGHRVCLLPVRLESNKVYAVWLNSDQFQNFKDADGRPAVPYLLIFKTR